MNNNPSVNVVQYGGNFTYSVTWSGGSFQGESNVYLYDFDLAGQQVIGYNTYFPGSYTYTYAITGVTASDAGGYWLSMNTGTSQLQTTPITVNVSPAILAQPEGTICVAGSSTSMGIAAGPSTATFQWYNAATGSSITGTASSPSFSPTTPVTNELVYCKIYNAYGSVNSSNAFLTVGFSPSISAQPVNVNATFGGNATFSVSLGGSPTPPIYYQWYKDGVPITGAILNSITIDPIEPSDIGSYRVVVTNLFGSVASSSASLLATPPTVTVQPTNVYTELASNAQFSVTVSGSQPLYYQWFKNGVAMSGANLPYIILPSVTPMNQGEMYAVTISNAVGVAVSSNATLNIGTQATITNQPLSASVVQGENAAFTIGASGTQPLTYQWTHNGKTISNATNIAYSINGVTAAAAGTYAVIVSNRYGSTISSNAMLTVFVPPYITQEPANQAVCVGSNATFIVVAGGTEPITYQWLRNGSNVADGGSVWDSQSNMLSVTSATTNDSGCYSVIVSNLYGSVTSTIAILNVGIAVSIVGQPTNLSISLGQNATFSVAASGSTPYSYQWLENGSEIAGATNNVYSISNVTASEARTYSVVVGNLYGNDISSNAVLTVATPPLSSYLTNLWQGLVSYYPFNGDANDAVGPNNGIVYGAGLTTNGFGMPNTAYLFDGFSDYIDLGSPSDLAFTNNFSVSAWCLFSGGVENPRVICYGQDNGYEIMTDGTGGERNFSFICGGPVCTTPEVFASDEWYAVAAVCQDGVGYIYVNGNLCATNQVAIPTYSEDCELGTKSENGTDFWGGCISNVRFYNRALSADEVSQLYALESANIHVQILSESFLLDGEFQVQAIGTPNCPYVLQATSDLTLSSKWVSLVTNYSDGSGFIFVSDTNAPDYSSRFYKVTMQ